jgi:hypothetical protein
MTRARAVALGLWALAAVGLVVGIVTARVVTSGEKEIAASTAALRAGDAHAAAEHARRAAGWYAPGAPHVRVAYQRLFALGTAAEGLGDRDLALFAFRGVRTAAIETRWIGAPHEEDLKRADEAIAQLSADAPRAPGLRAEPSAKMAREQLEMLAQDEAPRTGWVVALLAGAFTWALGAFVAVRRGVGAGGQVDLGRALPAGVLAGLGVATWLLAIWRA